MNTLNIQINPCPTPNKLKTIASGITSSQRLPNFDEFFDRLRNETDQEISDIECIWCITQKQYWDSLNPKQVRETSCLLWKISLTNFKLRKYLLRYLLRHCFSNIKFSNSLFSVFKDKDIDFHNFHHIDVKTRLVFECCTALLIEAEKSPKPIVYFAMIHKHTKEQISELLFEATQWYFPKVTDFLNDLTLKVSHYFVRHPDRPDLLLYHFENEQNIQVLASSVENLLKNYPEANIGIDSMKPLLRWLQEYFYQNHEAKQLLSSEGLKQLRSWIGLSNFTDFATLIDLVREGLRNSLTDNDAQLRQLAMRSNFWQNYSQRFEQIRMLIPRSSCEFLTTEMLAYTEILLDNYDPNQDFTEVCIFDFGTKIIVEFFRGRNSEIRLMDISKRDYLFNQQLSCERIRILGGEMHDHCVLWQTECERWLASHGIFPNDNLKTFKISKNFVRKYTKDSGIILEESDYIDLNQKRQKRQKCVESFNKDWKYR